VSATNPQLRPNSRRRKTTVQHLTFICETAEPQAGCRGRQPQPLLQQRFGRFHLDSKKAKKQRAAGGGGRGGGVAQGRGNKRGLGDSDGAPALAVLLPSILAGLPRTHSGSLGAR